MGQFELTNDLMTGQSEIDEQHQRLFELANQLLDANAQRNAHMALLQAMAFLGGYIEYHFTAEEFVMKKTRFPHFESHKAIHDTLRGGVLEIAQTVQQMGACEDLVRSVSALIRVQFVNHIRAMDRQFASYSASLRHSQVPCLPSPQELKDEGLVAADLVLPDGFD